MILFEANDVYGVEAGAPYLHDREITLDPCIEVDSLRDLNQPLFAHGLRQGDFAITATVADENYIGDETFLVTLIEGDVGELVLAAVVEAFTDDFADVGLTRKLQTAPAFVEILGLSSITNELAKRYPLYRR